MSSKVYDYVIITNVPAFYKINLYNKLAEKIKIKVIFISHRSSIRQPDFCKGEMKFDHLFLTKENFEHRNKFICLLNVVKIIVNTKYKKILYPGWELIELIPLMFLLPKKKNCILIESSILETKVTGFAWWLKKQIVRKMAHGFPSGILQSKILQHAGFSGNLHITHGVGLLDRTQKAYIVSESFVAKELQYLYVGRVSTEKNLNYLIDVFNANQKKLTIVGDGPIMTELKKKANSNICFTGYLSNSELSSIYPKYDVFVLPSISEPWGLVIDEALWYGLPVIVSNRVGCFEDLVLKKQAGKVFDVDDSDGLDKAITYVENNYSLLKSNVSRINHFKRDDEQINAYLFE